MGPGHVTALRHDLPLQTLRLMKHALTIGAALLLTGTAAEAQSGRMAGLPSPPPAASHASQVPVIVLQDGSVVADFGRGYERLIRACSAYSGGDWPGGQRRTRVVDRAPQGGSASRAPAAGGLQTAPGAGGLQPAPGMSAPPGAQGRTVGTSSVGQSSVGRSGTGRSSVGVSSGTGSTVGMSNGSLQSTHSGWRTAGPVYYDGACYAYDTHGRMRLIYR